MYNQRKTIIFISYTLPLKTNPFKQMSTIHGKTAICFLKNRASLEGTQKWKHLCSWKYTYLSCFERERRPYNKIYIEQSYTIISCAKRIYSVRQNIGRLIYIICLLGVGRGGGGTPNSLRGGPTYPLPPPLQWPPTFSFNFYVEQEKITNIPWLKGKIIINVTLIWFEGTGKTSPLNSILEFSIISDFKMSNVIILHWLIKNLVGTWRRNDVDTTSLRRIDVVTTSCACWEFGPPWPPNILNLPTPMFLTILRYIIKWV